MSKTPVQTQQLSLALENSQDPVVVLEKIAAPFTTVVNRALMTDLSKDLMPRMGVDRYTLHYLYPLTDETGPSGQPVFSVANDPHGAVRCIGANWRCDSNAEDGPSISIQNSSTTDYMEITFFGTGLNWLDTRTGNRDVRASIDGGAESSNLYGNLSGTTSGRNYNTNTVIPVVSGLTLGLHTAKIRCNGTNVHFAGYEVINTSGSATNFLQLPAGSTYSGGKLRTKSALSVDSYNSNFESGVLGTRGGKVVVYQKADGTVAKAVTPTDLAALTLASTNHTNEEIIQTHWVREYTAGRGDDLLNTDNVTNFDRAFALDDGSTSVNGDNVKLYTATGAGGLYIDNTQTGSIYFTFVGTGLDLEFTPTSSNHIFDAVIIDGAASVGSIVNATAFNSYRQKIVSGLPYGSHVVRLQKTTVGTPSMAIKKLFIYGPKKPTVPDDAVELGSYNVVANYSFNATANSTAISQGVIAKSALREAVLGPGSVWNIIYAPDTRYGNVLNTNTFTHYSELFFVGTGIEVHVDQGSGAANATIAIDGVNYTGAATATGSSSWTPGTSTFTSGTSNARLSITGLTYGVHRLRLTYASGSTSQMIHGYDIITPIHSPKSGGPWLFNNTRLIGSQGIKDARVFSARQIKKHAACGIAKAISSSPQSAVTELKPIQDMAITIETTGKPVDISWSMEWYQNTTGATAQALFQLNVNGTFIGPVHSGYMPVSGFPIEISERMILPLPAGVHTFILYWRTTNIANPVFAGGVNRGMTVKELD